MGELETLRRKYKEALELASRQALLLDQTHDALFAWDLDGRIKFWNRAATKLYGWSEEQALGRDVEDHKETRAIMHRLLSRDGHDVLAVGTVTGALDTAESAGDFDVLLCDIGLPDGSGYDIVRKVKAINPDTTPLR